MGAKYEAYIESEADGLDISVLAVVPDETPYRGILQLVHGMSEYKERYLPFMEYMAKKRLCMCDPRSPWSWEKCAGAG